MWFYIFEVSLEGFRFRFGVLAQVLESLGLGDYLFLVDSPNNSVRQKKSTGPKYHCSGKNLLLGSSRTVYGTHTGYSVRDSAQVTNVRNCCLSGNEM